MTVNDVLQELGFELEESNSTWRKGLDDGTYATFQFDTEQRTWHLRLELPTYVPTKLHIQSPLFTDCLKKYFVYGQFIQTSKECFAIDKEC